MNMTAESIDQSNRIFWDEMCGTVAARQLGITDLSAESLQKFDKWYFEYYPFLYKYLNRLQLKGNNVLEIGLGYGTVSSFLAAKAEMYFGADISQGPVNLVNQRLKFLNKPEQGSIQHCHNLDFPDNFFDNVVSIGCFHHTGSIEKSINEAYRVLKPGGQLLFMCYNKHSLRMLRACPKTVFFNKINPVVLNPQEAFLFDSNTDSTAAPFTELGSGNYYKSLCSNFSSVDVSFENCDTRWRKYLLNNLARILGLSVYVLCKK